MFSSLSFNFPRARKKDIPTDDGVPYCQHADDDARSLRWCRYAQVDLAYDRIKRYAYMHM